MCRCYRYKRGTLRYVWLLRHDTFTVLSYIYIDVAPHIGPIKSLSCKFPNFLTSKLQWDFVHEPPRLQSTLAEMQNDSHDHLPRGPVPGLPGPLDSMHDDPPMPLPRVNIDSVCCLFLQNEIMFQLKMEMVIEKEGSLPA